MDGVKPVALPVIPENIPSYLTALRQWVNWRYCQDGGKWTKRPFTPVGKAASSTDSATWATYESVLRAYSGFDGIGFVLSGDDDLIGADLDHCIAENRKFQPWALKIIFELDSYTEESPSGTGIRIFLRGKLPPGGRKKGAIEMYEHSRYLTITGHRYGSRQTIEHRQEAIEALHSRVFAEEPKPEVGPRSFPLHMSDGEILRRALNAVNSAKVKALYDGSTDGYPSHSEADLALCSQFAWYTADTSQIDRLFRSSGLYREKWDKRHFGNGQTYGEATISKATSGRGQ